MRNWNKQITTSLLTVLLFTFLITLLPSQATNVHPQYAGTKEISAPHSIIFKVANNSTVYTDSNNLFVEFTVYLASYDYMNLGSSLYSVTYTASWQASPVTLYSWSYHDPANLKDDDKNPQQKLTYKIDISTLPVGSYQIRVNATGGIYATDFSTWTHFTSNSSYMYIFTVANRPPTTLQPTPNPQSGILWTTNILWDLANSPAKDLWSSEISSKSRSWTTPVIVDGVLFAGATSEVHGVGNGRFSGPSRFWINIYAFNLTNGEKIWSYQANYQSITGLTFSDGKVFFGVRGEDDFRGDTVSSLYALNATDGHVFWTAFCPYIYAVPTVADGKVFADSAHSLLAFDEADGRLLWNVTATDFFFTNPVTADGKVFVSSSTLDHTFYALNTADGSKIWRVSGEFSSAAVGNGVVFVPSNDGHVYALNIQTGAELWRYSTTEFSWVNYTGHSTPLYADGVLYLTSDSGQHIHIQVHDSGDTCIMSNRYSVVALDANNGHKLWNYTTSDYRFESSVALTGSGVYVVNWRSIFGLNIHSGALNWNYTQPDIVPQTTPKTVNGTLYLGLSDGQIYAIKPSEMSANASVMGDFNFDSAVIVVLVFVFTSALFVSLFWVRNNRAKAARSA
jgi:outer membrane protein assembly factor BamB